MKGSEAMSTLILNTVSILIALLAIIGMWYVIAVIIGLTVRRKERRETNDEAEDLHNN